MTIQVTDAMCTFLNLGPVVNGSICGPLPYAPYVRRKFELQCAVSAAAIRDTQQPRSQCTL